MRGLLRLLGEQFTVSLCCIGPICVLGGFTVLFLLADFLHRRFQASGEETKGVHRVILELIVHILAFFPAGVISVLLARWVLNFPFFKSEWNSGSYFIVTLALVFLAFWLAFAYGISDIKEENLTMERGKSIFAFLGSYVAGVTSASLGSWLLS